MFDNVTALDESRDRHGQRLAENIAAEAALKVTTVDLGDRIAVRAERVIEAKLSGAIMKIKDTDRSGILFE